MFTLGVVGGSGSGKSTLVEQQQQRLDVGEHIAVLPHDAYYRDFADRPNPTAVALLAAGLREHLRIMKAV